MTEQQRLTIRAELARRMGIPENEWPHLCRVEGHALDETYDDALCVQCDMHVCESSRVPPDPFTNAEDKEALVKWLAADDARWFDFRLELGSALSDAGQWPEEWSFERAGMTASRETITLAAAKALGIGEEE